MLLFKYNIYNDYDSISFRILWDKEKNFRTDYLYDFLNYWPGLKENFFAKIPDAMEYLNESL